jgi:hypothetical protein
MKPVSLELAKKLQDHGIEVESAFYWCWYKGTGWELVAADKKHSVRRPAAPAPTLDELLEVLPKHIRFEVEVLYLSVSVAWNQQFRIGYYNSDNSLGKQIYDANPTLTDAAAQLLIWCVENNHMEVGG